MKRDIGVYIDDILESIKLIEKYTKHLSEKDFHRDTQTQDAVLRRLSIIGETIKHIPKNFKTRNSQIPWKKIAGMRDILIHEYFGVRLDRAWQTIKDDLPQLKKQIKSLLR